MMSSNGANKHAGAHRRSTSRSHSDPHRRAAGEKHPSSVKRKPPSFRVVVLGASAGGVEALTEVVRAFPPKFPAAVLITLHISPDTQSFLPEILGRCSKLPTHHAVDGERIRGGHIYIAPPDVHLLVKDGYLKLARGPRENSSRPAVDPMFRTAARSYGPWVIGVILSGGLDDGTLGLMEVKKEGGTALVQDPTDAHFPGMPTSASQHVPVDYVLPLGEIGPAIAQLVQQPIGPEGDVFLARWREREPDSAEMGTNAMKTHEIPGTPSTFTCPDCGGTLWELAHGSALHYRCHVGHAYTSESLVAAQRDKLEAALWTALRALEENAGIQRRLARRARDTSLEQIARRYDEQAAIFEARAGAIRDVLTEQKDSERKVEPKRAVSGNGSNGDGVPKKARARRK